MHLEELQSGLRLAGLIPELLDERALAADHLAQADVARLRAAMDEARARRLQPHYIELAFREAFSRLGGVLPCPPLSRRHCPSIRR